MAESCEVCGEGPVQVKREPVSIVYGAGEEKADLTFEAEMVSCLKCGSFYTGRDYEEAEIAAINAHKEKTSG